MLLNRPEKQFMERIYDNLLFANLTRYQQMAFISGPIQVGKTTSGEHLLEMFGEGPCHPANARMNTRAP